MSLPAFALDDGRRGPHFFQKGKDRLQQIAVDRGQNCEEQLQACQPPGVVRHVYRFVQAREGTMTHDEAMMAACEPSSLSSKPATASPYQAWQRKSIVAAR